MDADFSIELGRDDPVLDFPWKHPAGKFAYVDLKRHPELMAQIEEADKSLELGEFLRAMNSAPSMMATAKCDVWSTTELSPEEEIYGTPHKFASYVDLVFSDIDASLSLPAHKQFVRKLIELLRRTPETPSAADVCVRRCYYEGGSGMREGYYFTLYVSGYGNDDASARLNWGVGLKLVGNAILQMSARGVG
ncbi:MAG TPA: hypothetical protein VIX14_10680 [Terriglobales bacterium]